MKIKRIEHIAIAVNNMDEQRRNLEHIFGFQQEYEEQIGQTKLAMFPVGETYIELLQAVGPESKVGDWVRERGQSLFHLCFEVENIDEALQELKDKGIKLLDETPRTGHGGSRIAFINPESTGDILIELTEPPADHA